jgi:HAD superfamily hydrolase (TIGR01549 family)
VERFLKPLYFSSATEKQHSAARRLVMAIESPGNFLYNLADLFDLDGLFIRMINYRSKKRKHQVKKYWIIPGVQDLLSDLVDKFSMGVVSARDEKSTMAFIRQFELEEYFKVVVTSQTCRYTKPFPDPLLFAAEKLGIEPQSCLMVGDTTVDMKAAKLADMQAVGVLCGFGRERELRRAGADVILPATTDLLQIIFSHEKTFSAE